MASPSFLTARLILVASSTGGVLASCGSSDPNKDLPPLPTPTSDWTVAGCSRAGSAGSLAGPCCTDVACYEPDGDACLSLAEAKKSKGITLTEAVGSGTCACGANNGVAGPFSVPSDYPKGKGASPGQCCYTSTYNSCTGRPLVAGGVLRVARLTATVAWA